MNPTAPADAELASLCGVINASHARLVAIVADALDDQSWAIAGVRSPEHWLTMRAGVSPVHARQVVGVARRRGELPSVMAEFASGQLSLDQVAVVVRYAPAHVEASVAELAVHASVPQLRRALSHYSFDPPAENGHTRQSTTFPTTTSKGPTSAAPNSDSSAATPQGYKPTGYKPTGHERRDRYRRARRHRYRQRKRHQRGDRRRERRPQGG